MVKILNKVLLLLFVPLILVGQTQIIDTLLNPTDSIGHSTVSGTLTIVSTTMNVNGTSFVKTLTPIKIVAGIINTQLAVNDVSTDVGSYYTANYSITENGNTKVSTNYSERWYVITSLTPLTISQIRQGTPPTSNGGMLLASQITAGTDGNCLRTLNSISQWFTCGIKTTWNQILNRTWNDLGTISWQDLSMSGSDFLNGAGIPTNSIGFNGDFYLDTSVTCLYGPKTGGVWSTCTSLAGTGGGGTPCTTIVTFSSTPNFDFSSCTQQLITLTGSITPSISNAKKCQVAGGCTITFVQGASSYIVTWPGSVLGGFQIGAINTKRNVQAFTSIDGSNIFAITPGIINQ